MKKIQVSVSLLSADFLNLEGEIKKIAGSTADLLHFDVMDGVFVNNITFGIPVLESVRKATDLLLDVHLMIAKPQCYIEQFASAGADIITFHAESDCQPRDVIKQIKACGKKAGIAVNPDTPAENIFPYLDCVDTVLIMSVFPGFGGQAFIPDVLSKVPAVKSYGVTVAVDGGIDSVTAKPAREAGADILVSGSYLFKQKDFAQAVLELGGF
ncbi:MAG: ribulose-phosphate 3-epimerase [Oscillospiraceae bacterium]|jgi:ribulose-phosphate 3-epimerase|nr:ribulose-phosphate 3-epimerase [Oscillospiraceae bacterium]